MNFINIYWQNKRGLICFYNLSLVSCAFFHKICIIAKVYDFLNLTIVWLALVLEIGLLYSYFPSYNKNKREKNVKPLYWSNGLTPSLTYEHRKFGINGFNRNNDFFLTANSRNMHQYTTF